MHVLLGMCSNICPEINSVRLLVTFLREMSYSFFLQQKLIKSIFHYVWAQNKNSFYIFSATKKKRTIIAVHHSLLHKFILSVIDINNNTDVNGQLPGQPVSAGTRMSNHPGFCCSKR